MCNASQNQTARQTTIDLLKQSIPKENWDENQIKLDLLKEQVLKHPLFEHNIITRLKNKSFSLNKIQSIHLEYQHSIVEIFTDALLMSQFQAKQLDNKIFSSVKMYPRFLIAFNINDEFGLSSDHNSYKDTPLNSHFCLFKRVLDDLSISKETQDTFVFSKEAINLRNFLESTYSDYIKVVLALAIAEQQVITFSPPLRESVANLDIAVNRGYYNVHGTTDDGTTEAADDLHEQDLWLLLTQALHFYDFEEISQIAFDYCDLWNAFWNKMDETA